MPRFGDGDLDAGLVFVVAAPGEVVGRDDRLDRQQVGLGQNSRTTFAQQRRAAKAADPDLKAQFARVIRDQMQSDVMGGDHRAVALAAGNGDLELARQELEFAVIGGPLAQEFRIGARVGHFIGGGAGEGVSGDVADGSPRSGSRAGPHRPARPACREYRPASAS